MTVCCWGNRKELFNHPSDGIGEIAATIADANGIAPIIQLLGNPDPKAPPVDAKIKQTVFLTVAKIAKIGKLSSMIETIW